MSEPHDRAPGQSDTSRAVAFSDAVLAIVITLLVLDLRPPEGEPGELLTGLVDRWPTYLAYITSYFHVGVVWLNHKAAFRRIVAVDRGLHWTNLLVLFTTALLPFPTAVVAGAIDAGSRADERTAVGMYALIGVLLCLSWLWFYHYLGLHPDLIHEDVDDDFFPRERMRALVGVALYAAAGAIGYLISPLVAMAVLLVLPVFYGITSEGLFELVGTGNGRPTGH